MNEQRYNAESVRTCETCAQEATSWYLHPIQQVYICWPCVKDIWPDQYERLIDGSQ